MEAILALNAGSSSVKVTCYEADGLAPFLAVQADGIGGETRLKVGGEAADIDGSADHATAIRHILTEIVAPRIERCVAVGHRVVHGGARFTAPEIVNDAVLADIAALTPLAPSHQPHNVTGIRSIAAVWPQTPQVACFDTAFHATIPRKRQVFAIPKAYEAEGVRRYGFHGLSYEGVMKALPGIVGEAANGRVIAAHLGNGASLCAISEGKSRWTSMGFTPLEGLVMGRRPGRLDPGVLIWLMREKGMDADAIDGLLNRECGLYGLSGLSQDMRDLLESDNPAAALAVDVFVDRLVMEIGAAAAAIGGADVLVFTGGIGENAAPIRERVADALGYLGFSAAPGGKPVIVVPADEEGVIAAAARDLVAA